MLTEVELANDLTTANITIRNACKNPVRAACEIYEGFLYISIGHLGRRQSVARGGRNRREQRRERAFWAGGVSGNIVGESCVSLSEF